MIGVSIGIPFVKPHGIVYDTDAQAYFTQYGITNTTEKNAWNNFVLGAKANGIYTKFLHLWPVSPFSFGASVGNAVNFSFPLSAGTAPSYSTNGHQYNGTTQFLKTGVIPGTHLTTDNVTLFYTSRSTGTGAGIQMGASTDADSQLFIQGARTDNTARLNGYTNATLFNGANTTRQGNFFFILRGANDREIRRNTTQLATSAAAHALVGACTHEIYVGARNNAGTADTFCSDEITFYGLATGLTATECNTLSALLDTYQANVIAGGR